MTTPIDTRDAQSSAPLTPRKSSFVASLSKALALVLLGLLIAAVALIWLRLDRVESEGKQRGAELASRATSLETQSKLMQDTARELTTRANAVEARITEAANSQAQLEKLYSNRSTDDTDALLSDIEQSVSLANQQLLASGQIASALLLLQDADRGALKSKNPSLLLVHRLLLKDIEKLKAAPAVDVIQLSNRLDSVGVTLDSLPLITDMPKKAETQSGEAGNAGNAGNASRWTGDLKRLFNIHKVDDPSALLLSPEQAFFVRQNAKLALASARLALFSRNETLFKADIQKVSSALKNYFDGRNARVGAQIANLEQLSSTKIAVETPTLSETLNAIRSARNQR
jgi:uroporphyrin-III C-methyltransferase